jgi:hypothetical protein
VLTIYISEELYNEILSLAVAWYGKSHGALSAFVEELLRKAIAGYTAVERVNPSRSIRAVYYRVREKVKELMNLDYYPSETTEKILDAAIAEVRGSDPRTIEKWKVLFEKSGLIKFIGGFKPNRVVELL